MKNSYISLVIFFTFFAFTATAQKVFKAQVTHTGSTLIISIVNTGATPITSSFDGLNFFIRFPANVSIPSLIEANIVSNATVMGTNKFSIPSSGLDIYDNTNQYADFFYSASTGSNSETPFTTFNVNTPVEVLRIALASPSAAANIQLVSNEDEDPYYVAIHGTVGSVKQDLRVAAFSSDIFYPTTDALTTEIYPSGRLDFSEIDNVPLPVKFLSFTATKKDNTALLNWQIENETPLTKNYEAERSLNGIDFKAIDLIAPKNNGRSSNSYTTTDADLYSIRSSGVLYYRVKQTDKDGRFIYSDIKTVHLDGKNLSASIYPNPVKGIATLSVDLVNNSPVTITINDASGKKLQLIQLSGLKGLNTKTINMTDYAAGNYSLQVQAGNDITTIPVIKGH